MRGIFQFRIKSLFGESNSDISPVFAWRFWRKFLAMGSTGNGAALGRLLFNEFNPVKNTGSGRVTIRPVWKVLIKWQGI